MAKSFTHIVVKGVAYDVGHLNAFRWYTARPAEGDKPEQTYPIEVVFSSHCFTKSMEAGCPHDEVVVHNGESRQFDQARHELSKQLPDLIRGLMTKRCFHTPHSQFATFEMDDPKAPGAVYGVYFDIERTPGNFLLLRVRSAYPLHLESMAKKPWKGAPIAFRVIVHNCWHGRPIAKPRR